MLKKLASINTVKMSQNIVADVLNQMMNAIKARKEVLVTKRYSKLVLSILALAKLKGYVKEYSINREEDSLKIVLGKINGCSSISPRYAVNSEELDKYVSRFLPSKNIGIIIVSTSKGLMTHLTAQEKKLGGSLIAYFY